MPRLYNCYNLAVGKSDALNGCSRYSLFSDFLAIHEKDNYQLQGTPLLLSRVVSYSSQWMLLGVIAQRGLLNPANLQTIQTFQRVLMGVAALSRAGMTVYYIKDMPVEKRSEKGALVALVALFALEGVFGNTSRLIPLRAVLGVATAGYGLYFRARALGIVDLLRRS